MNTNRLVCNLAVNVVLQRKRIVLQRKQDGLGESWYGLGSNKAGLVNVPSERPRILSECMRCEQLDSTHPLHFVTSDIKSNVCRRSPLAILRT